ncbi:MAG: transcriptional regulator BetI [Gammaproteobacteria bacterium]|nr:transcriptional regulator BetI [Gammaproteobacteria bacterium]
MPTPVTEKNFASRSRKQQRVFRKQQLIEATIDCIDKFGISQTTLAKIAERAGLSQGNVVFHFQSKEALLEQTLHHLNDEYQTNWEQAIASAGDDPYRQLRAMIEAAFAPKIFNRRKISVWFAFWGESRSRPKYMKVCGANDQAFSYKLQALCAAIERQHGARLGAKTAALSFEGMIDGLWQNFLIGAQGIKRDQAIKTVFELLESVYPDVATAKAGQM